MEKYRSSYCRRRVIRHHKQRGAAVVEMALVLPILMMLLLGMIEFGRALSVSQMLTSATREYCRKAIIRGESTTNVVDSAKLRLKKTISPKSDTIKILVEIDNPSASNKLENAKPGDLVTIRAEVPFTSVQYFNGSYLPGLTLKSQCSMTHE